MTTTPIQARALADQALKNVIINGNFDFWQRNTTFSGAAATDIVSADRWRLDHGGGTYNWTLARVADVPSFSGAGNFNSIPANFQSQYSLQYTQVSAGSGGGGIGTRIEGYDYAQIHGRPFRLQFWVKSSVTGTYSVAFGSAVGAGRTYVTTYAITTANTWQRIFVDVPANTTGSWNFDTSLGMFINWNIGAGNGGFGNSTSTVNSWQTTGSFTTVASTGTAQVLSVAGATFQLAQVALYVGKFESTTVLPFNRNGRSVGEELRGCQRYYQKAAPSTTSSLAFGHLQTGTTYYFTFNLQTPLRATPIISTIGTFQIGGSTGSSSSITLISSTPITSPDYAIISQWNSPSAVGNVAVLLGSGAATVAHDAEFQS